MRCKTLIFQTFRCNDTVYQAEIPFESIGLSERIGKRGFQFNLLINDNDGFGREGWIQITDGIAGYRSSDPYPLLVFETR